MPGLIAGYGQKCCRKIVCQSVGDLVANSLVYKVRRYARVELHSSASNTSIEYCVRFVEQQFQADFLAQNENILIHATQCAFEDLARVYHDIHCLVEVLARSWALYSARSVIRGPHRKTRYSTQTISPICRTSLALNQMPAAQSLSAMPETREPE